MKNLNQVTVSGNVTKDAELRGKVLSFSIACNEMRKNGEEWEEYPNFFDCVIFGKFAETMEEYITKGVKVAIQGKLLQSRWEDDNGDMRSRIQIVVDNIEVMQRKEEEDKPKKKYSRR